MAYDLDGQPVVRTLYVALSLDLPPLTAQAAFDNHRRRADLLGSGKAPIVQTPVIELVIFGDGAVERSSPSSSLRRVSGRLRHRRHLVGMAVEVELAPWSDRRCQIGIRPRAHTVPMTDGLRRRRYFDLALKAAGGLAQALELWVEDWLAAQLHDPDGGILTYVA